MRLHSGNDCNVVVRNTLAGGAWGSEERAASYFPFMPGAVFDMIIMATPNSFKVSKSSVDGMRWMENVMALLSCHVRLYKYSFQHIRAHQIRI